MKLTDSHCHLDFDELASSLPHLLSQCSDNNIHQLIIPSIAPSNWQKVLELVENNIQAASKSTPRNTENELPSRTLPKATKLYACLGIHPWFLSGLDRSHLEQLSTQVMHNKSKIIAIGEAGIDGGIVKQQDNLAQQQLFFSYQVALAKQHDLPIIVHHRQSHQELIAILKTEKIDTGGVIHAFSGSYQQAKTYIDLGFSLGIGGTITYPRAKKTINAIKRLPLSSLVLETDAPSMPLFGYQGETNSPLRLTQVFDALTQIRGESAEVIAEQVEENIQSIFNLKRFT
jgi:TatD DNase family protein